MRRLLWAGVVVGLLGLAQSIGQVIVPKLQALVFIVLLVVCLAVLWDRSGIDLLAPEDEDRE
jgi:hypothetical protein